MEKEIKSERILRCVRLVFVEKYTFRFQIHLIELIFEGVVLF